MLSGSFMEKNIYRKLGGTDCLSKPTAWVRISTKIALLFAIYGSIPVALRTKLDVSVLANDFTAPMAVWYAREMGLPICTIICSCSDDNTTWDLLQRGEIRTADVGQMEALVHQRLGIHAVNEMVSSCMENGAYRVDESKRVVLGDGLYFAVVGSDRTKNTVCNFEMTSQYRLTESAATACAGLQDYRAATGESRNCLILLDDRPVSD